VDIIRDVIEFFIERNFVDKNDVLDVSESLLERGTIDSLAIRELIAFIESRYKIKVDEEDMFPENFDSLAAISAYVTRKIA